MSFVNPHYLVDTETLAAHLSDPDVRVLDVTPHLTSKLVNRARQEHYERGHIPGALFFDVASGFGELSDPTATLPWSWPDATRFAAVMARFGVANDTRVVLVAKTPRPGIDSGTMWCTRAWWTMHHMGVDCAILAGGVEQWVREGRPLVTEEPTVARVAPFVVAPGWESARADRFAVLAALGDGASCVVDALAASSFDGTDAGYGSRKGHISGAVNVPFRSLIAEETAQFGSPDALKGTMQAAGLLDGKRVITYCGGAIAATVDAFVLALLGHEEVAVYDGSLMEWSADASLPMEDPSNG